MGALCSRPASPKQSLEQPLKTLKALPVVLQLETVELVPVVQ